LVAVSVGGDAFLEKAEAGAHEGVIFDLAGIEPKAVTSTLSIQRIFCKNYRFLQT